MSLEELRAATARFDRPDPNPRGKPLTRPQRERFDRIVKRGRPTKGKGAAAVMVSLEKGLLAEVDQYIRAHDMSRSELIAVGLKLAMKKK